MQGYSAPSQTLELREFATLEEYSEATGQDRNDGFTGSAPDLGALEVGGTAPHYGPRD